MCGEPPPADRGLRLPREILRPDPRPRLWPRRTAPDPDRHAPPATWFAGSPDALPGSSRRELEGATARLPMYRGTRPATPSESLWRRRLRGIATTLLPLRGAARFRSRFPGE